MKKVRLRKKDISYIRYSTLMFKLEIGLNNGLVYILEYDNVNKGFYIYSDIYKWLFNLLPVNPPSIRIDYKYKKTRGYALNLEKAKSYTIKQSPNISL